MLLLLNPLTAFICFFLSFLSLLYWGRRKLNDWIAFDRSLMRVMTTFVFLLSILATRTVSTLLDTWHYQKALPKAIEVEGWADAETKSGWLEGSGVVIFRLSPNTIKRIQVKVSRSCKKRVKREGSVSTRMLNGKNPRALTKYSALSPTPSVSHTL